VGAVDYRGCYNTGIVIIAVPTAAAGWRLLLFVIYLF